ncbi:unnamed protein product, partial [Meganyctiphanes norvegica]
KLCRRMGWLSLAKLLYAVFISMTDIGHSNEMCMEKSAYIMISQELGRDRYQDLRSTLLSEGFEAQPWYKINDHCNSITPERIPVTINDQDGVTGYRFRFKDVCTFIVNRSLLTTQDSVDTIPDKL